MKRLPLSILIYLLLCSCGTKPSEPDSIESESSFTLGNVKYEYPMEYIESNSWLDGGTLSVRLEDKNGKTLRIFRDGALSRYSKTGYSETIGKFSIHNFPHEKGAIFVDDNEVESFIYKLVKDSIRRKISEKQEKEIRKCFEDKMQCTDTDWAYKHIFALEFVNKNWAEEKIRRKKMSQSNEE